MVRIFLSYRHRDAAVAAEVLHRGLKRRLGRDAIFLDTVSLTPGADWLQQVTKEVRSADWVLVLIGRGWLERDAQGALRLSDREDVVRLEVSTALTRGIATLPVRVDGAPMPHRRDLPLSVAAITRLQGERLSLAAPDPDIKRIGKIIGRRSKSAGRTAVPRELVGLWTHTTPTSGSSYEFSADGTYTYLSMLTQSRPMGPYSFEVSEEGLVDVTLSRNQGEMKLQPIRASATQKDTGSQENSYVDAPRDGLLHASSPAVPVGPRLRTLGRCVDLVPSVHRVCCVGGGRSGRRGLPEDAGRMHRGRVVRPEVERSAFTGFRFPPEVITVAVRWYLRFGISYRDVEELLVERGVEVDHGTVYRWVQRFTPLFADAARLHRHATGDRWFVDETYVKVAGRWRYLYRAVDQFGQVIDVLLSEQRDTAAARRFFTRALRYGPSPVEVTTDKAGPYLRVLDELLPAAMHVTEQYANNRIESDHGRLKARLRPMRGLKRLRSAVVLARGHAFIQNLRRGHYELTADAPPPLRVATAFAELAAAI